MTIKKNILFCLLLTTLTFSSYAHSYWLEVTGSGKVNEQVTVNLYFGEFEKGLRENKAYFLKNMESFTAWYTNVSGKRIELKLLKDSNCYKTTFTPDTEGIYTIMMKEDTRDVQDWKQHGLGVVRPIEYLKAVYMAGNPEQKLMFAFKNDKIDITHTGNKKMQLLINNLPSAGYEISITGAGGKSRKIKTGEDGQFSLALEAGIILIDVDYKDILPGEFKGKMYESIRYKFALTVNLNK